MCRYSTSYLFMAISFRIHINSLFTNQPNFDAAEWKILISIFKQIVRQLYVGVKLCVSP